MTHGIGRMETLQELPGPPGELHPSIAFVTIAATDKNGMQPPLSVPAVTRVQVASVVQQSLGRSAVVAVPERERGCRYQPRSERTRHTRLGSTTIYKPRDCTIAPRVQHAAGRRVGRLDSCEFAAHKTPSSLYSLLPIDTLSTCDSK